jgi:hypothetical protein
VQIVPFQAAHIARLKLDTENAALPDREFLVALEDEKYSYTLMQGERVVACLGVIEWWEGRGEGWMFLGPHSLRELCYLYRAMKRFFEACPFRRVEAVVRSDFPEAQDWVKSFGFKFEGHLTAYSPEGDDTQMFAKIRESH